MGGVDRGDQLRETGAGFCRKAHFHKWYKKSFMAIADFMILNSYVAWNMAANEKYTTIKPLRKYNFHAGLAEEMTHFTETDAMTCQDAELMIGSTYCAPVYTKNDVSDYADVKHTPVCNETLSVVRKKCVVCMTELAISKRSGNKLPFPKYSLKFLHACAKCEVHAHTGLNLNSKWQNLPGLRGKSCFEILHSETCVGL